MAKAVAAAAEAAAAAAAAEAEAAMDKVWALAPPPPIHCLLGAEVGVMHRRVFRTILSLLLKSLFTKGLVIGLHMQAVRARKAAQGKAQLSLRQIRRISVAKTIGGLQSPEPGSAAAGSRTTPSPRQVMFSSPLCETNVESSLACVLVTPALHRGDRISRFWDLDRTSTG